MGCSISGQEDPANEPTKRNTTHEDEIELREYILLLWNHENWVGLLGAEVDRLASEPCLTLKLTKQPLTGEFRT